MKLIVGLGNPGKEYERTRHNIGFRVADLLAGLVNEGFDRRKFKGEYADVLLDDLKGGKIELLIVKPQTFMNCSGEAVLGFSGYYKIELDDILVVSDDVNLPLGTLRMRSGGSDGGQKGLRDISLRLGSQNYARLRVGVGGREAGREHPPQDLAGHVLSRFASGEEEVLKKALPQAAEACLVWARKGASAAANLYNKG
ncbi:MAG TPA: aminoacyl-tRNA hydrolase [Planctomycetota bacterium]|nr:aminoacyl-tRNA hydrolase [Planctomycetota bacterium]